MVHDLASPRVVPETTLILIKLIAYNFKIMEGGTALRYRRASMEDCHWKSKVPTSSQEASLTSRPYELPEALRDQS